MAINFTKMATAGAHASTLNFTKAVAVAPGERIELPADLTDVRVELYWESANDGDASVVLLNADKKAVPAGIVFYDQLSLHGVTHSGDVKSSGDGDSSKPEETIRIKFSAIPAEVDSLLTVASTYPSKDDTEQKAVPFGKLRDCRALVINDVTNEVLYGCELDEDFSTFTSVELTSFYRKGTGWRMTNMNAGVGTSAKALEDIAAKYDIK